MSVMTGLLLSVGSAIVLYVLLVSAVAITKYKDLSLSKDEKEKLKGKKVGNCGKCGKPCACHIPPKSIFPSYVCTQCRESYIALFRNEIKQPLQKNKCHLCSGSGKVKGYKCLECNGVGYKKHSPSMDDIRKTVKEKWKHYDDAWFKWQDYFKKSDFAKG